MRLEKLEVGSRAWIVKITFSFELLKQERIITNTFTPHQGQYLRIDMTYPETKKIEVIDHYFDTPVADPYRWLEDDNSAETKNWVIAQNQVTQTYLTQIPFRAAIKKR